MVGSAIFLTSLFAFALGNPLTRRAIDDLDDLDLLDAEGREIPIYNADGRRIARRIPYILEDEQPLSILQDLSLTHELFTSTLRPSHEGPSEDLPLGDLEAKLGELGMDRTRKRDDEALSENEKKAKAE